MRAGERAKKTEERNQKQYDELVWDMDNEYAPAWQFRPFMSVSRT